MAKNKKAQGLPITTIILVVIGLLVLFVIIAFFTGAFGKAGANVRAAGGSNVDVQISDAQTKCAQWCLQGSGLSTLEKKRASAYCLNPIAIDLDGDGVLKDITNANDNKPNEGIGQKCVALTDNDEYLCCWESPISYSCQDIQSCRD